MTSSRSSSRSPGRRRRQHRRCEAVRVHVIGDPVNEAARLTELAKSRPGRLLVSDAALSRAGDLEAARFERCDELVLRGRSAPTKVAAPRG